jgi:succinate dehydrogenase flavin-adding protein (antitoxin of CptAB toxin-antitoxin module)
MKFKHLNEHETDMFKIIINSQSNDYFNMVSSI